MNWIPTAVALAVALWVVAPLVRGRRDPAAGPNAPE